MKTFGGFIASSSCLIRRRNLTLEPPMLEAPGGRAHHSPSCHLSCARSHLGPSRPARQPLTSTSDLHHHHLKSPSPSGRAVTGLRFGVAVTQQ